LSSRRERERVVGDLEQRGLLPSPARRAAIRTEAEQVARRVTSRRRMTAHQAVITLLAQRDPDDE
jgi:hypothetical protein